MKECPACRRCFPDDINHCPQDGDATTPSLLGEPILDARYQLERRLGQGGMGAVYKARDTELDRLVALKIIRPELTTNPEILKRFKQELILARQVTHRNVIRIFDLGQADGFKFITMEYLEGQDLRAVIREKGKLTPEEAARTYDRKAHELSGEFAWLNYPLELEDQHERKKRG